MTTLMIYLLLSALLFTTGFGLRINQRLHAGRILGISPLILLPTTAPLVNLPVSAVIACHFGLLAAFQLGIVTALALESIDQRRQHRVVPTQAEDGRN